MPNLLSRAITQAPRRQLAEGLRLASFNKLHTRCLNASAVSDQLAVANSAVKDNGPPLRVRKHGFKSLPISPLFRPDEATAHPKQTRKDEALQAFQKEVATNPYARALATPIRFCSLTLARIPTHFLLPFTTLISQTPPTSTTTTQLPKVSAHLTPGHSTDHSAAQTLTQTSYIINRQDMVRHLSRKKHWTSLVTDRQKSKLASIAHRNSGAQKLVQDHWVWENQVDAMGGYLEGRVVGAVRLVLGAEARTCTGMAGATQGVRFVDVSSTDAGAAGLSGEGEAGTELYDLSTLLSPENLDKITTDVKQNITNGVLKLRGPKAWQVRLALDRLKTYKAANEIQKELPMVQNPAGTRGARQQELQESEFGTRSDEKEEREGGGGN